MNSLTKLDFYANWVSIIKGDLNRIGGPLVFANHPGLDSIQLPFQGTDTEIAIINAALQDIFGYTAFVCLLAGIMTFREDSTRTLGYAIDFWNHPLDLQTKLLRKFVGRGLFDLKKGDIADTFLTHAPSFKRSKYWISLFTLGFKREQMITPIGQTIIDHYFTTFNPENYADYLYASHRLLDAIFSDYMGEYKMTPVLNKKSINGRIEAFNLLYGLFKPAFKTITQKHSGQETFLVNKLMQKTMDPLDKRQDPVGIDLYGLGKYHSSTTIKLGTKGRYASVSYEVDYDTLTKAFLTNRLTEDFLFTWLSSFSNIQNREISNYFLDFNYIWNSASIEIDGVQKVFSERFEEAYNILKGVIDMVTTTAPLKVKLYGRTEGGINNKLTIKTKPRPDGILPFI